MWVDVGHPGEPRYINLAQAQEITTRYVDDAEEEEVGDTDKDADAVPPVKFCAYQAIAVLVRGDEHEEIVLKVFRVKSKTRVADNAASDAAADYVKQLMAKMPSVAVPIAAKV